MSTLHNIRKQQAEDFKEEDRGDDVFTNGYLKNSDENKKRFDVRAYELFPEIEEVELKEEEPEEAESEDLEDDENATEVHHHTLQQAKEDQRLEEIEKRSTQMLREAAQNISALMEESTKKAFEMKAQAREEGYRIGHEEGMIAGIQEGIRKHRQELMQECETLFRTINRAAEEVEHQKEIIAQQYLEDLRDLAITIAEKIISISLKSSSEVIEKMIRTAIEARRSKPQWANISISDKDYEKLLENGVEPAVLLESLADRVRITVVERAEPGTCLIEFPEEIIDASVSTQVHNIVNLVKNTREY